MKYSKKNKLALITGAAGLMGRYHAEALAEVGYNLVLIDLNIIKLCKLKKLLAKKFKKLKIYCYDCDITSEKQVNNFKENLDKKKLFISCLINNADINPKMTLNNSGIKSKIEDYKLDNLKKEISVGIFGTFNCIKLFGSAMAKKNDGIIINISSDLGVIAPDQRIYDKSENIINVKNFKPIGYSISKHALHGMTKYLSQPIGLIKK